MGRYELRPKYSFAQGPNVFPFNGTRRRESGENTQLCFPCRSAAQFNQFARLEWKNSGS